jgi:hypothetical protein
MDARISLHALPHTSLDGIGVLHVVGLFSPLPLWSLRAWIAENDTIRICVMNNVQVRNYVPFVALIVLACYKIYAADLSSSL